LNFISLFSSFYTLYIIDLHTNLIVEVGEVGVIVGMGDRQMLRCWIP
jgi:hypothetical protein